MTNKEASAKYGVPKNTIQKQNKLRGADYAEIDNQVVADTKKPRSQQIPIDGVLLKEKALYYAKELDSADFKASDGWLARKSEKR